MKYMFRFEYAACLILLLTLVSRSSARPLHLPTQTVPTTSSLHTLTNDLQDNGATGILLAGKHLAVDRTVVAVAERTNFALATRPRNEFEPALDEVAAQEASAAREACIRLEWETAQAEKTVAGGTGCDGLPQTIADLKDQLSEIRPLAYTVEDDVRAALQVQRLVANARRAVNDVIVAGAVCGTVEVNSDNAGQMLEAAGQMARTKLAYGSAVRLYSSIIEGAPGTEEAAAAMSRVGIFGPDVQQKLAATVRSAAAACDAELARVNLMELDSLMVALSERAVGLVDQSTSRSMPDLKRAVRAMDGECGSPRVEMRPDPVPVPVPTSNEVITIEGLIANRRFDKARAQTAKLSSAEEQSRLQTLLDANEYTAKAEKKLQDRRFDEAIAFAEKAWLSGLLGRAGIVLADSLSARAEAILADGRPGDALEDVQLALIAAPESGRAQRAGATVYRRLGKNALASGDADEALQLFRESTRLLENGNLRLEMARLLAARERILEAHLEAEHAERLGVPIDVATRIQIFALGYLTMGQTEAAWLELDKVGGKNAGAVNNLKIHTLRLPLSASIGRLAAGLANAKGLTHRGTTVLTFVGSDTSRFKGSLKTVLKGLSGPGSAGFSADYRYMAFCDWTGGIVIFDARTGKAAGRAHEALAKGRIRSLAALARAEVVEALAWFLAAPIEEALNSDMVRGEKDEAVLLALEEMVAAGLDYALLANSRGRASLVKGSIGEDYETGLQVAVVSAPNMRSVLVDGASYREVVAPVKIGDSVQVMLVLGVAVNEGDANRLPRADRFQ